MVIKHLNMLLEAAAYHQGPIGSGHRIVGPMGVIQATAERDHLVDKIAFGSQENVRIVERAEERAESAEAECARLRAEVERMRPVVDEVCAAKRLGWKLPSFVCKAVVDYEQAAGRKDVG